MLKSKANSNNIEFKHSNGITAVYLPKFKIVHFYLNSNKIESITSENLTIGQLTKRIESYV